MYDMVLLLIMKCMYFIVNGWYYKKKKRKKEVQFIKKHVNHIFSKINNTLFNTFKYNITQPPPPSEFYPAGTVGCCPFVQDDGPYC